MWLNIVKDSESSWLLLSKRCKVIRWESEILELLASSKQRESLFHQIRQFLDACGGLDNTACKLWRPPPVSQDSFSILYKRFLKFSGEGKRRAILTF